MISLGWGGSTTNQILWISHIFLNSRVVNSIAVHTFFDENRAFKLLPKPFPVNIQLNSFMMVLSGRMGTSTGNSRKDLDFFPVSNVTSCEVSGLVDGVPYAFFGHSLGALVAYETARLGRVGRGREIIWNFVTNYHTISPSSWVYLIYWMKLDDVWYTELRDGKKNHRDFSWNWDGIFLGYLYFWGFRRNHRIWDTQFSVPYDISSAWCLYIALAYHIWIYLESEYIWINCYWLVPDLIYCLLTWYLYLWYIYIYTYLSASIHIFLHDLFVIPKWVNF